MSALVRLPARLVEEARNHPEAAGGHEQGRRHPRHRKGSRHGQRDGPSHRAGDASIGRGELEEHLGAGQSPVAQTCVLIVSIAAAMARANICAARRLSCTSRTLAPACWRTGDRHRQGTRRGHHAWERLSREGVPSEHAAACGRRWRPERVFGSGSDCRGPARLPCSAPKCVRARLGRAARLAQGSRQVIENYRQLGSNTQGTLACASWERPSTLHQDTGLEAQVRHLEGARLRQDLQRASLLSCGRGAGTAGDQDMSRGYPFCVSPAMAASRKRPRAQPARACTAK
jgi:hypothetical protein